MTRFLNILNCNIGESELSSHHTKNVSKQIAETKPPRMNGESIDTPNGLFISITSTVMVRPEMIAPIQSKDSRVSVCCELTTFSSRMKIPAINAIPIGTVSIKNSASQGKNCNTRPAITGPIAPPTATDVV